MVLFRSNNPDLIYIILFYFLIVQGFQSQISGLQEEMEEKEQEMEKLRHELKDKEVENKIAGKKGDQLVRTSLLVQFLSLFR